MDAGAGERRWTGWRAVALLVCAAGCAELRLPAIDPTGERIFASPPAYTTLVAPELGPCPAPWWPEPAFTAPPTPPPCPPAWDTPSVGAVPSAPAPGAPSRPAPAPAAPRPAGRLVVAPAKLVAAVGAEVVVTAGYAGPDGRYAAGQTIEFQLSADSVGHFVEAAPGAAPWLGRLLHRRPAKRGPDYVVLRASDQAQLVTRGTPETTDDVVLDRGQTWVSLTSATEGATHVTVVAPQADRWDQRRATATIYWVDAQWELPPPATVRAGQPHTLTARVTRSDGQAPSPAWLVRFEAAGGAPAGFGPDGAPAVEVPTDAEGRASVQLVPGTDEPGETRVLVQIIRPAGDGLARTVIGQGWTTVTWSAARLRLALRGPERAAAGAAAAYVLEAANTGDLPVDNVEVRLTLPPGVVLLNSEPAAQVFGDRLHWRLGVLAAGASRTIQAQVRLQREGEFRLLAEAEGAGGLRAEASIATRVAAPALTISMTGPERAAVGDRVQFRIEVANRGAELLRDVTIVDRFDAGLAHVEGQASPIMRRLGDLAPGQTQRVAVTLLVRQPGRWRNAAEVRSGEGERASAEAWLEAVAAPAAAPRLEAAKTGPAERRAGETAEYVITVTNAGAAAAENVRIVDQWTASLQPQQASPDFQAAPGRLEWTVARLEPGETATRRVRCLCLRPDPNAANRVTVSAAGAPEVSAQAKTRILPGPAAPPAPPGEAAPAGQPAEPTEGPAAPPPPAAGRLNLAVAQTNNPIRVGEQTTYLITLENDRDVSDKNVALRIVLPDGLRFETFASGFAESPRFDQQRRVISPPPIAEVRPREQLPPIRLTVTAVAPGQQTVAVEAVSLRSPDPVRAQAETTVLP